MKSLRSQVVLLSLFAGFAVQAAPYVPGCHAAACLPPKTPEEVFALAVRTRDYVAPRIDVKTLKGFDRELAVCSNALFTAQNDRVRRVVAKGIRQLRRRILFSHPDLAFDRLLAVQRGLPYSRENHMVDQYVGRWSRPGPGLVVIENWKDAPRKRSLLGDKLPVGTVLNPDLHWDADRLVFAFCDHTAKPPADAEALQAPVVAHMPYSWRARVDPGNPVYDPKDGVFSPAGERSVIHHRYFLYECAADGSWVKQITGGPGDPMTTRKGRQTVLIEDVDPCYLPDGGIVFTSTRCQNYGRCHWGRYTPAFQLYRCDAGGANIRQLSFGEANEWEPAVLADGRIAYTRWDYINRHAVWHQSLWTTYPDGSATAHLFGNYSENIGIETEVKQIPNSPLLVATGGAHHLITGGSLFLLDTRLGEDGLEPVMRLTPEIPFPESEGWQLEGLYAAPEPINDTLFLCAYSDDPVWYPNGHEMSSGASYMAAWPKPRAFGIWLVDSLGGRELIYQDAEWSTLNPIPFVKRAKPPVLASKLPPGEKAPDTGVCWVDDVYDSRQDLPRGSIKALRITKLHNLPLCCRDTPKLGPDLELHKESLGTVPVNEDGSAAFRIPAGESVWLQALDAEGKALLTMRSFIYSQKGEVQGCLGCHENKMTSRGRAPKRRLADLQIHDPKPEVDLGYKGPFRYTLSIQPIFDAKCISCHGLNPQSGAPMSLIGAEGHANLVARKQVKVIPSYRETHISKPYDYFAGASPLYHRLRKGHGPKLTDAEWKKLILWMDHSVSEYTLGGYGWNRPERRAVDPAGEKAFRACVAKYLGAAVAAQPFDALVNRGDEKLSRVLTLPGAEAAREELLAAARAALVPHPAEDIAGTCGRDEACQCRSCWIRRGGYNNPVGVDAEGFVSLFNGRDLTGWTGAVNGYGVEKVSVKLRGTGETKEEAVLVCQPEKGGGNLVTVKEYENFILRFEFCMPENGNNGLGLRMPSAAANGAYDGLCEIQLLDDGGCDYYDAAAKKDKLKPWQYTGSVYGVVPVRRDNVGRQIWGKDASFAGGGSYLRKAGSWNFAEVRALGSRVQVILNGYLVTDADLAAFKGDGSDTPDRKAHPGLHRRAGRIGWLGHGSRVMWRNIRVKEVPADYVVGSDTARACPKGFTPLFATAADGLVQWKGVTTEEKFDNPAVRQAATPEKRAAMQRVADAGMVDHWHVRDGALFFDGFKGGYSLATKKDYKDFEMWVDWRLMSVTGDSGLYLRGSPQVQIWDANNDWGIGSGGLYNNQRNPSRALCVADRPIGSWNTFRIVMKGERVSVWLNGAKVVDDTVLENYFDRSRAIFPVEQIELQCHGDPLEFKNIFIREL